MSDTAEFPNGLIVKAPHERAPDFVKARISIKVADLGVWLGEKQKAGEEWVNLDVKVAKTGTWYAQVSTFKPNESREKNARRGEEAEREIAATRKGGSSVVGGKELDDDLPF